MTKAQGGISQASPYQSTRLDQAQLPQRPREPHELLAAITKQYNLQRLIQLVRAGLLQ